MKITESYNDTVTQFIDAYPDDVRKILKKIRQVIKKAAPKAQEAMAYGIPTFKLNGNLVHFSGFKKHIGFFPSPSGIIAFKKELAAYKTTKGTIQFPLDKPIPYTLITKIVKFRVRENTVTNNKRHT